MGIGDFLTDYVLPAGGAIAGGIYGGPLGAFVGYQLGDTVGAAFDPNDKTSGLSINRAQSSKLAQQEADEKKHRQKILGKLQSKWDGGGPGSGYDNQAITNLSPGNKYLNTQMY